MILNTTYRLRQMGRKLRQGDAWITGKTTGSNRWPDQPHYWVINDSTTQTTHHVLVDTRPMWDRYDRLCG